MSKTRIDKEDSTMQQQDQEVDYIEPSMSWITEQKSKLSNLEESLKTISVNVNLVEEAKEIPLEIDLKALSEYEYIQEMNKKLNEIMELD